MENAVVYARYSSHNQTEQSIEGQLSAARKYAELKEYNIVKEYCDRAKTGTNDNREAFQQMLADCKSHAFTVIIVWKVDRFGRNREEITFNKYRAKKQGVRVEYIAENITEGPEGVILESVLEGMAEYYSLQLSQNVKRGHLESAKKYHAIGGRLPLGYKLGPDNEYLIDPETAPIIRLIFDKYNAGQTMAEIIRYLNDNGYRNRKGALFTKNSLPSILSNERYMGTYLFKDIIRQENAIPAIVSKEQFESAQRMKERNRKMPSSRWSYSKYLLTSKLFCGECGSPMVGKSGYGKQKVKYNYYTCLKHVKKECRKKSVRQDILEKIVIDEIMSVLSDPDTFDYIVELIWKYRKESDRLSDEIENITHNLNKTEEAIANLVKSVEQGMPYSLVQSRMQELTDEKAIYTRLLGEKQASQKSELTKDEIREFYGQFVNTSHHTDDLFFTENKKIVDCLINSVYLYDDRVVVSLNCCDEVRPCVIEQELPHNRRTFVYKGHLIINKSL